MSKTLFRDSSWILYLWELPSPVINEFRGGSLRHTAWVRLTTQVMQFAPPFCFSVYGLSRCKLEVLRQKFSKKTYRIQILNGRYKNQVNYGDDVPVNQHSATDTWK